MLDVDARQLALRIAQVAVLVVKILVIVLKQDTIELLVLYAVDRLVNYIVAPRMVSTSTAIARRATWRSTVLDHKTGFLVPPNDPARLASRCRW